ncbi:MAG TPA: RNase adapter RapZ, partial [Agriterribacter sp.]|nr:RNase adapter RapZ [Agriterribacter sp.]
PELQKVLWHIVDDRIIARYETVKAVPDTSLVVYINSFSYRNGIPGCRDSYVGGFVFDCRGIFNPGRFEAYKQLTGRDKEVQEFLLHKSEMPAFLQYVYGIVDISVSDYIKRGFESLTVNFGCTGGQHRSVFAADSLFKHLQEKFGVKVALHHLVQEEKNWVNE